MPTRLSRLAIWLSRPTPRPSWNGSGYVSTASGHQAGHHRVSVSSLGKTGGPLKDVTGFGPANQAFASLPSMMGYPGGPPASMGGTWPDYVMGVAMAYLAVAGLYHRKRTGQGHLPGPIPWRRP